MIIMHKNEREELYTVYGPKTTFEMSWKEAEDLIEKGAIGILIFGATEQHGIHNPSCPDTIIPLEVAKRASLILEKEDINLLIYTPIPFGMSHHHVPYAGSIALRPETAMMLVEDIGRCMIDQGIKKIVLIVGHTSKEQRAVLALAGHNLLEKYGVMYTVYTWMEGMRLLSEDHPEVQKLRDMTKVGYWFGREDKEGFGTDAHGGAMETGPTLAVMPNLVHQDWIISAPSPEGTKRYKGLLPGRKGAHPGKVSGLFIPSPGPLDDFFKKDGRSLGHIGDPTVATAEWGDQFLNTEALGFAELIRRLHRQK
jgi:creatinine amidohydrolase/Fe(II)-dependent formamide hydrolase-like protein